MNSSNIDPIQQLLLDALHRDPERFPSDRPVRLDAGQWRGLLDLAVEHRVVPWLHYRLTRTGEVFSNVISDGARRDRMALIRKSDAAAGVLDQLAQYSRQVAKNNLRHFAELQKLLTRLEGEGIPVILLKGIRVNREIYPGPGLREMNDMDLLFRREDLPAALRIVRQMGYAAETPVHINQDLENSHHLPPLMRKGAGTFELHWNITRPGKPYSIDPSGLWQRSVSLDVDGKPAAGLSPEDQLLHLCLHTSHQHLFSFGLRPFCDIELTIRHYGKKLNWSAFTARARQYGWEKGVWLSLRLAHALLGAEVPKAVIEDLEPERRSAGKQKKTQGGKEIGHFPVHPEEKANVIRNQTIHDTAISQLFTPKKTAQSVMLTMIEAVEEQNITGRIKTILKRIFLPADKMITLYPVKKGSLWLYAYYPLRCWHLLARHSSVFLRLLLGEKNIKTTASRKQQLDRWLNY